MFEIFAKIFGRLMGAERTRPVEHRFSEMPAPFYSTSVTACLGLASQGRLSEAEIACKQILQRTPDDGCAWDALGMILIGAQKYEDGLQALARATACSPPAPQYFVHYAVSLVARHKYEEALTISRDAYARWPHIADVALIYAQSLAGCFMGEDSRAIFDQLVADKPRNMQYWTSYAHSMLSVGFTADVIRACEHSIAIDESARDSVGLMYFRVLAALGRAVEAKENREQSISRLWTSEHTQSKAIDWIERNDGAEIAEPLWRNFVIKNTRSALAIYRLAENLAIQGRWSESMELVNDASKLALSGGDRVQINALIRSVTGYVPDLNNAISAPRRRHPKPRNDVVIVIRGGLDHRCLDIVKHYGTVHSDHRIILSTWAETPADLLAAAQPYVNDIVLSERPPQPGMNNLNYQIVCAERGVKKAKEYGAAYIFLTRTDLAFMKPGLLEEFSRTLADDNPDLKKTPGLKKRLIICDLYSLAQPFYHASDIFCYGTADDVANLWSSDHMTDSCLRPEVTLSRGLAAKIGRPLTNDIHDSLCFFRDAFIVRDADSLGLFWRKYPGAVRSDLIDWRPFVSQSVWSGSTPLQLRPTPI